MFSIGVISIVETYTSAAAAAAAAVVVVVAIGTVHCTRTYKVHNHVYTDKGAFIELINHLILSMGAESARTLH